MGAWVIMSSVCILTSRKYVDEFRFLSRVEGLPAGFVFRVQGQGLRSHAEEFRACGWS